MKKHNPLICKPKLMQKEPGGGHFFWRYNAVQKVVGFTFYQISVNFLVALWAHFLKLALYISNEKVLF